MRTGTGVKFRQSWFRLCPSLAGQEVDSVASHLLLSTAHHHDHLPRKGLRITLHLVETAVVRTRTQTKEKSQRGAPGPAWKVQAGFLEEEPPGKGTAEVWHKSLALP
jgi:hypothetical protein